MDWTVEGVLAVFCGVVELRLRWTLNAIATRYATNERNA